MAVTSLPEKRRCLSVPLSCPVHSRSVNYMLLANTGTAAMLIHQRDSFVLRPEEDEQCSTSCSSRNSETRGTGAYQTWNRQCTTQEHAGPCPFEHASNREDHVYSAATLRSSSSEVSHCRPDYNGRISINRHCHEFEIRKANVFCWRLSVRLHE